MIRATTLIALALQSCAVQRGPTVEEILERQMYASADAERSRAIGPSRPRRKAEAPPEPEPEPAPQRDPDFVLPEMIDLDEVPGQATRERFAAGLEDMALTRGVSVDSIRAEGDYGQTLAIRYVGCSRVIVHSLARRAAKAMRKVGFTRVTCEDSFRVYEGDVDE